jgi:hypothetical protein
MHGARSAWVPKTTYWLMRNKAIIGLDDYLELPG